MKNFFLKMKHWQLFLLLFLPSLVMGIYVLQSFPTPTADIEQWEAEGFFDPSNIYNSMKNVIPLMQLSLLLWPCYMLVLLFFLNNRVPSSQKRSLAFPVFALIFPVVYLLAMTAFMLYFFQKLFVQNVNLFENVSPGTIFAAIGIIFPCHLFAIFAFFYSSYVAAKLLKTAEMQREPKGDEFIGEFFLFWMFIVGVWLLQPRINKLFEQEECE